MIEVQIEDAGWNALLPEAETLAQSAAEASLSAAPGAPAGDTPTNVLSFPAGENPHGHIGDVALALGVCAAEARAQAKPLADHLRHLVAHGVLHLVGYDHEAEAEAETMEALEREILADLGVPDPYAERDGASPGVARA
jgi:probable rRNA maturation factor